MKRICVYCGSSNGFRPEYKEAAVRLGSVLVEQGLELVYGGGRAGLMGQVALSVLNAGGKVTGVIPRDLADQEVAFTEVSDLRIVESMHSRKTMMAELSDGFIALPGGLGTFEELFEILTWAQLGYHGKPCGILNISGYYDSLLEFLDNTVREGFVKDVNRKMLYSSSDPEELLADFRQYKAPVSQKIRDSLKDRV